MNLYFRPIILLIFVIVIQLFACSPPEKSDGQYHCPMHPTYISNKPGDCPICGMRLVPIETKTLPTVHPKYVCPMHPEVTSDHPEKCSKCGMDLVLMEKPTAVPTASEIHSTTPADAAQTKSASPTREPSHTVAAVPASIHPAKERKIKFYRNPMDPKMVSPIPTKDSMGMDYIPVYADDAESPPTGVAGMATVNVDSQGLELAGMQIIPATRERMIFTIRTVGVVNADETRIRHVHTKISGYVEKLFGNFTGQYVRQGEPILAIYSPELLAGQEEFLRAGEIAKRFQQSDIPEVKRGGEDLVKAAQRRLELFDVPESFIQQLIKTGIPQRAVTLNAPVSGFVTSKNTFEGQQVEPGMELFTVTDLSHVWIEADFYEYEARAVRLGQRAKLSFPYDPTVEMVGTVSYIYPYLNAESRTLKVRFDFANPTLVLKPSMYVDVALQIDAGESVVVPDSAVMDTGMRQMVFVKQEEGRLEPRRVKVGVRNDGKAQILSGVKTGELVVVRANFLIDSESRLRAAVSGATAGSTP